MGGIGFMKSCMKGCDFMIGLCNYLVKGHLSAKGGK